MKKIFNIAVLLFVSVLVYGQSMVMSHSNKVLPYTVTNNLSSEPAVLNDGNTEAWYEAHADYLTITDDSVSQWDDRSGNNYDLTQATSTKRPVFAGDSVLFEATGIQMVASVPSDVVPG